MNSELKEQMKDYNKLKKEFEKPIEIEEERQSKSEGDRLSQIQINLFGRSLRVKKMNICDKIS